MKHSAHVIEQRRNKIIELLQKEGKQQVNALSEYFHVSPLTIRRDLNELEAIGLVKRIHGGVSLHKEPEPLSPFVNKQSTHNFEKEQIARYAASYVQEGSTIFMNSGTTILHLLKLLNYRFLTIVTNNLLAYECCSQLKGNLIYTGGVYNDTSKACLGDLAITVLNQIYANLCILGVNGFSADSGATTSLLQEAVLNGKMIERCSGKVIVIADSSKIGKTYSFTSAKLQNIDILITGSGADPAEIKRIREQGVEVHQVDSDITDND